MNIVIETPDDYKATTQLTFAAFETFHSPYLPPRDLPDEHYLVHIMRDSPAFIPELAFVGWQDGDIIANIMYTKSKIVRPNGDNLETITFGPLSVKPQFQNQGYGAEMVHYSLKKAHELGYGAVVIVGHPDYYSRFGFKPAKEFNLTMPEGETFDPFMALELEPGYLGTSGGVYYEDKIFHFEASDFRNWHEDVWSKRKFNPKDESEVI
ncbi:MAG: N-acetyltransferase [Clostridiales Family XIII bacterium]|nr:N-acetyltransferase [Clostridiales Family XIII bacterium]